jgi:hypothetical protein
MCLLLEHVFQGFFFLQWPLTVLECQITVSAFSQVSKQQKCDEKSGARTSLSETRMFFVATVKVAKVGLEKKKFKKKISELFQKIDMVKYQPT